ncbi:MAG: Asp-tRNA(Asn)/Glu-tRNA(Gln) amidotransferase subunit GatA, partial [Deltaproteobacteria bacterium]
MTFFDRDLLQLRRALDSREVSSRELTEACFERIGQTNERINSFISINREAALAAAEQADRRIAAGEAAPLTGIPLAVKDIFNLEGTRTTAGSRLLENYVAPYDATAVARLKQQDAVILGKLNMDEFAMGSSNENSAFGPCRNPWNPDKVPGGSSGGSAAAVAARQAFATLGTDTGGSIRQPASHCGVVGLKPTYGRVSRYGVIAYASSLDQVGPVARSVADAAILLQAIAGYDPADSTSVDCEVPDYSA